MNDTLIPIIIAVIAALPGLMAMAGQRKQTDATAAGAITDAAVDIVAQYKERLEALETGRKATEAEIAELRARQAADAVEIARLRRELGEYRVGIVMLIEQIRDLGHTPKYQLPGKDGAL